MEVTKDIRGWTVTLCNTELLPLISDDLTDLTLQLLKEGKINLDFIKKGGQANG